MDKKRADLLLRYALVTAAQNDEYIDRQLAPIHLIKYVYLADLAYAQQHGGQTFTEVAWRFHKFGPWSPEVFNRIEPALSEIGATKIKVSHPKYEDDFVRWMLVDDELAMQLASQLPVSVSLAIQSAVRSFGSDTASLLNHVYLTEPMLRASPDEHLDLLPSCDAEIAYPETSVKEPKVSLSRKEKEERKRKLQNLRILVRERLDERKRNPELVIPDPLPRYDEVFQEGLGCFDLEAGSHIEEREENVVFSDDVWKSRARYDPELP